MAAPTMPAHLVPFARATYRNVYRASRQTFKGDALRHIGFMSHIKTTFRSPFFTPPSADPLAAPPVIEPCGPEELRERINGWNDIAQFLRKNVVQGRPTGFDSYELRINEDTELGDNETIRKVEKDLEKSSTAFVERGKKNTPFPNRNKKKQA